MNERTLLGGLDGMAVAEAWRLDRPPQAQVEVDVEYAKATWWADVWVRLYDATGTLLYDATLDGRVGRFTDAQWVSFLTLKEYPQELSAVLATHPQVQYLWMETSERRPPTVRFGLSVPFTQAIPQGVSMGEWIILGIILLMLGTCAKIVLTPVCDRPEIRWQSKYRAPGSSLGRNPDCP